MNEGVVSSIPSRAVHIRRCHLHVEITVRFPDHPAHAVGADVKGVTKEKRFSDQQLTLLPLRLSHGYPRRLQAEHFVELVHFHRRHLIAEREIDR